MSTKCLSFVKFRKRNFFLVFIIWETKQKIFISLPKPHQVKFALHLEVLDQLEVEPENTIPLEDDFMKNELKEDQEEAEVTKMSAWNFWP